jgi:sulfhydrogenase subunit beta (sulfur reductase)
MADGLTRVFPRTLVPAWIERMMSEGEVIAPCRGPGGEEVFSTVSRPEEVLWDFENPLGPPKAYLLPQTEPLAQITRDHGRIQVEPVQDDEPRILLNLRSCDLTGILFLKRVLAQDPPDRAFLRRAEAFTLISLACTTPCPLGFCVCCGAGPFLREGFDLQLWDLGESVLAEVGGEKGLRLLQATGDLHRAPTAGEMERRDELQEEALRGFGEVTCHFASAMRRISTRRVEESLWSAMAPWCLDCGGCNLACPTCYCFSVKDLEDRGDVCPEDGAGGTVPGAHASDEAADGKSWTRYRIWDSCQYPAFTLEASGHNPRAARTERMKRRFYHKVSAQYYQRDGILGCVGCGRCIRVCLGATTMPAVVEAIRTGEWKGAGSRTEVAHV